MTARLRSSLNRLLPGRRGNPLPGMKHRHAGGVYLTAFIEHGGLQPDHAVLEPGCGTGRMAESLAGYLSDSGSYDGFDVVADAIEWCQGNVAPMHPSFRFRHVDVHNRTYNPDGRLSASEFEFPYPSEAFDFALITSVFTHMQPPEVRHYLDELGRVLRPGARCFLTFFLLNEETLAAIDSGRARRRFKFAGDGYRYEYRRNPEVAVAYREEDVRSFVDRAGLALVDPILYGDWSGRADGPLGQDVVICERTGPPAAPGVR